MDTTTASILNTVADLIDADTRVSSSDGPKGITELDDLIFKAAYGPWAGDAGGPEWARICHSEGLEAARAWSDSMHRQYLDVCNLLFPKGNHSPSVTSAEIRALANSYRTNA